MNYSSSAKRMEALTNLFDSYDFKNDQEREGELLVWTDEQEIATDPDLSFLSHHCSKRNQIKNEACLRKIHIGLYNSDFYSSQVTTLNKRALLKYRHRVFISIKTGTVLRTEMSADLNSFQD
jgi:hypothetical protein